MKRATAALAALLSLCGCGTLVGSATSRLARDLSDSLLNQNDVQTVREGLPAFLLLVDGLIEGNPGSPDLLLAGARLYGAYATAFVEDPQRARRMSDRAHDYGQRALCAWDEALCLAARGSYDEFVAAMDQTRASDVPVLYGFGAAWAGWVQTHSGDWAALAQLPRIQLVMERVVRLDEAHDGGGAHADLGVL